MSLGKHEIESRFGYHKVTTDGEKPTVEMHKMTRKKFRELAEFLDTLLPEGRSKSVTFTNLETAAMWANKAIAELAPVVGE